MLRALCWFLLWGSIGGNTINAFFARLTGKAKTGSSLVFELVFFVYYGPLFLIIATVNALLRFAPRVPKWFSAAIIYDPSNIAQTLFNLRHCRALKFNAMCFLYFYVDFGRHRSTT